QFAAGLVELAERDGDPGQERGAEPVQRHPPAAPVEQRDAEFALQAADRPAERGLRHAEFLGRAAEAAGRRSAAPAVLVAVLVFLAVESTAAASLRTPLLPTL